MKITARLWLYIAAIVASMLALIWYFLVLMLPGSYRDDAVAALDAHSDIILQLWESGGEDDFDAAAAIVRDNALSAEARTLSGDILLQAGWQTEFEALTYPELEQIQGGRYMTKQFFRPGHGQTLLLAKPVYLRAYGRAIMIIRMPMAPVEEAQALLNRQLLPVSLCSLGAALIIAFLASRMFLKPIRVIERMAGAIAEGDFSRRIGSKDRSELGDLARAVDAMAERLGGLEAMRRDFIARVSHQFKTPLSIIQGHAELIQDSLPPDTAAALAPSFGVLFDEIDRLSRMSGDILLLSRLQSSPGRLRLAPLRLKEFCLGVVRSLSILPGGAALTVDVPESVSVMADAAELDHVLRNICQNALLHSGASRIAISSRAKPGSLVEVKVSDNGRGMSPAQLEGLWTRFYKGDPNSRTGFGLGMAIAAAVLDAHGSSYGAYCEGGATVWFTLRAAAAPRGAKKQAPAISQGSVPPEPSRP
ncbi:MAG: HAMP domain-containing histidine kinase [Oscillospiraceae bacterium]|jgi:signal transduction histidine kinase|nr:HAMP domain-containing histidine kinase [Oscillospiraceae bacterium]